MRNLIQLCHFFFQNQGTFLKIFKQAKGDLPLSPIYLRAWNNTYSDQRLHGKQIVSVTDRLYEKLQYSTLLISMIKNWENTLDKGRFVVDLSKTFDTLNHDLLIAKLGA